jgi:NADPH2:quinone reductase
LADVARMQAGEAVLVHAAAGGVGTTALQLARILGAGLVIGTVGSPAKEQAARAAGAEHVVSYAEPGWSQQVRDLTGGRGVDVVLDSVAGPVTAESMQCLAPFGRLVNFGDASGDTGVVKTVELHSSCRAVLGFSLGTTRRRRPELLAGAAAAVMGYLADGRLSMRIGAQFPLASAASAHRLVETRQSTGKVLLTVSP